MRRLEAISGSSVGSRDLWMGQTHVAPSTASASHHHGISETGIYVVSGHPEFVFLDEAGGEPGERRLRTSPGDYIYVPPWVPHREENPDPDDEAVVVIARTTQEAIVVNLADLTWIGPLFQFGERAWVEADGEWLAGGERVPGAYLGIQGVLVAAEGEDGDLGFGFEVHDPVEGDPGAGVLADFAYPVYLLASASGGDHLGDQEQVACVIGADLPADGGARNVAGDDKYVGLADSGRGGDVVGAAGYVDLRP
jgi:uncharacterized RmlC-like cupin family protein